MPNHNDTSLISRRIWLALIVGIFAATCLPGFVGSEEAKPAKAAQWSTLITPEQLRDRSANESLLVIDARSPAEYAAGHIPGALLLSSEEFLNKESGTTISVEAAKAKIEKLVPKGKTVGVYCQSGTRCSHEELILKHLGYENVILYDASWQEWGNRADTPVEKSPAPAPTESAVDK
jgi:3-mercaptopyruvate sulfurtransferase SseA